MIDMIATEKTAILHAGTMGGEYLDSIKITDLSRLTIEQYGIFIRCVVSAYLGQIQILSAQDEKEIPFP
jgi:hypothetical protein